MSYFGPVEREHILAAIIEVLTQNDYGFGQPDRYYIEHRGYHYPAKMVVGISRQLSTGQETPWHHFVSGPKALGPTIRRCGFRLVNADEGEVRVPEAIAQTI